MNRESLLKANAKKFDEIIGNGKMYKVPDFQRDYSWKQEQWEDLWEDILEVIQEKSVHYMGAVVFQNTSTQKEYLVIDGQQRLATLSLLTIACIRVLQESITPSNNAQNEANLERIEIFRRKFLGEKNPVSLHHSSKLKLNENNDFFYQSILVQLKTPLNLARLSESERLLWEAQDYFYKKVKGYFGNQFDGEKIADFLDNTVANNLLFIEIVVEDDLSAYTVFETLNSRGVELTSTDLLKNYLLSLVVQRGKTDLTIAKEKWTRIIDVIGLKTFPTFLRHYLNSKQSLVARDNLFKIIKPTAKTGEEVFELLDELEKHADVYVALGNGNDSHWINNKKAKKYIDLFNLLNIRQVKPLLLAAYMNFDTNEFNKLLRICGIVSFRYNTISGANPKEMETSYNRIAIQIREKKINNAREAFLQMRSALYIEDASFKANFSHKKLNSRSHKKLIKYIFIELENKVSNQSYNDLTEPSTLEHIMPESYSTVWNDEISTSTHQDFAYRLGNYTLLEDNLNRACSNKNFETKREIYEKSKYKLTNQISENYLEWNANHIVEHQEYLAKLAVQIWRIDV